MLDVQGLGALIQEMMGACTRPQMGSGECLSIYGPRILKQGPPSAYSTEISTVELVHAERRQLSAKNKTESTDSTENSSECGLG